MKILVVGSGGREHALVYRLTESGHEVIAAPGNPGIEGLARCIAVKVDEHAKLVELALDEGVDLVVVGPEAPLVAGLADKLRAKGKKPFDADRGFVMVRAKRDVRSIRDAMVRGDF